MKKIYSILLGALALTALDANAATVQDIVGEYTCTQHQLYDYYWFGGNYSWQLMDFAGTTMSITSEGGNTVKLNGFIVDEYTSEGETYTYSYDLVGEFDETSSTITFQPQLIFTWDGGGMTITSAGDWGWFNTTWAVSDTPFSATVGEDGTITFDYYAVTYGGYAYEYCQVNPVFTPVKSEEPAIVGKYTCTQNQIYDCFLFGAENYAWQLIDFAGNEMEITSEGGDTVKINGFIVDEYTSAGVTYTNSYDLIGTYDAENSVINFEPQFIYSWTTDGVTDGMTITGAGDWGWWNSWNAPDLAFKATVAEDGTLTFDYTAITWGGYVYEYNQLNAIFAPVEDSNSIKTVTADTTDEAPIYYNLQGVRVANPTHGIFISKGKKIKL
jgi:hypothetical protein